MTDPTPASSLHVLLLASSPLDAGPVDVHSALAHLDQALRDVHAAAQFTAMIAEADAVAGLLARRDRPLFPVLLDETLDRIGPAAALHEAGKF